MKENKTYIKINKPKFFRTFKRFKTLYQDRISFLKLICSFFLTTKIIYTKIRISKYIQQVTITV